MQIEIVCSSISTRYKLFCIGSYYNFITTGIYIPIVRHEYIFTRHGRCAKIHTKRHIVSECSPSFYIYNSINMRSYIRIRVLLEL